MYAAFVLSVFFVRTRLGIESAGFMQFSRNTCFVCICVFGVEAKGIK